MPRSSAIVVENQFTKGLITEATGLNFPEHACTETYNCVFSHTGEVSRRLGIDYEDSFSIEEIDTEDNAIREFLWKAVSQNGEFTFLVLQVGTTISFFSMESTSLSPTKKTFTVNLEDFRVAGSPALEDITCSFDSGNGYLFVTHPYCSPFFISYDAALDTITTAAITLQMRDFEGVIDGLDLDQRPTTLTKEHHYNLINQGWGVETSCTVNQQTQITGSPIEVWHTGIPSPVVKSTPARSDFPSNADIWWTCKTVMRPTLDSDGNPFFPTPLEAFSLTEVDNSKRGISPAPKGHVVLTVWYQDRAAITWPGLNGISFNPFADHEVALDGIPVISSGYQRPSCVAFYAGRVWYTGINAEKFNTKLYFSRIIEKNTDFGKCHQDNDPTGEDAADLLPSDGGVIVIPAIAKIIKMQQIGNALFVFATNGVWRIEGSQGVGFTATDYTISKVSSTPALSETSFVDVEGTPMWWNHDGIWMVEADQTGVSKVNSLTFTTIDDFIANVPSNNKKYVKGAYNPLEKKVQWVFRSTEGTTVKENYQYDRVLNLSLVNQAFYPWSLEDNCNKIVGLFVLQGVSAEADTEVVVDNSGNTVTTGAGDVTVNVITRTDISSRFKYITTSDCFVDPSTTEITYDNAFLGHLESATFGNGNAAMQNGIIVGDDGKYYTTAATSSFNFYQIQKFDGSGALVDYSLATFIADIQTELGHTFDLFGTTRYVVPVPYTPYFYFMAGGRDLGVGFGTNYTVFGLYKINSSGTIVFQGAKAYLGNVFKTPLIAAMIVHCVDFKGEPTTPVDQELIFGLSASGSITFIGQSQVLVNLPSVTAFIADSGNMTEVWDDLWLDGTTDNLLVLTGTNGYTRVNSGFFLPVNNSGVWDNLICIYLPKGTLENYPLNSFLAGLLVSYPNGCVIGKSVQGTDSWAVLNSHFKAEDTSDLIPFADFGLNKDDSSGDYTYNDWETPSVQHDLTSELSLVTWGRHFKPIELNQTPTGSYTKAIVQAWDPVAQAATFVDSVEGSPWDTVIDYGFLSANRYGAYTYGLFLFLSPTFDQMYVYTRDDGVFGSFSAGNAHYSLAQFADVTLNLNPATTGLTFSEFVNDSYLDWQASGESEDFTSYFITGYKVHGDALRKFQNNYIQLYTNNDTFSQFDFQNRWDYAISGDTGRWSNKQRITMDDTNYKYRSRRLKTRGHGKALQYKVNSVLGKPFNIIGWSTWETGNSSA